MTYTRNYGLRYPRPKNAIKDPWIPIGRPLRILKSVISLLSRPHSFALLHRPSKKLSEKNLGPFEIIAQVGWLSFTLRLPEQLRAVLPVFHVSQLEPATRNIIPNRAQPPPPPIEVNDDIEFEISEILDSKINKRRKCQLLYLVRWTGYEATDQETDCLSALELTHAKELVQDFHSAYPHKPGPLSSLNT